MAEHACKIVTLGPWLATLKEIKKVLPKIRFPYTYRLTMHITLAMIARWRQASPGLEGSR